jgi:hypothetical protein
MMHSQSPSEGIWGSLGDLLLLTPMQSYRLPPIPPLLPEAKREKRIKKQLNCTASSSLRKNITSNKQKGITPRAHTPYTDHIHNHGVTIVFLLSFLGVSKGERE